MDLEAIRRKWLSQCGSCDAGLPMSCTCPDGDPRGVILELVHKLEKIQELLSDRDRDWCCGCPRDLGAVEKLLEP